LSDRPHQDGEVFSCGNRPSAVTDGQLAGLPASTALGDGPEQREALVRGLTEGEGDTLMEIVRIVCPNVEEVLYVPFEWEFDLTARTGRMKAGDVLETEVETLRGFGDPPPPYRILVTIPGGFEYTGEGNSAETGVATKLRSDGAIAGP
jgi:hypothetical protein